MTFHVGKEDLLLGKVDVFIALNCLPKVFEVLGEVFHDDVGVVDSSFLGIFDQEVSDLCNFLHELLFLFKEGWEKEGI